MLDEGTEAVPGGVGEFPCEQMRNFGASGDGIWLFPSPFGERNGAA
jgi:hypothetical protein